jgi:2-methylcitrate dehydratase PrpD
VTRVTLSRQLVRTLFAIRGQTLPAPVARAGRFHLLDAVGVGLGAASTKVGAPYCGLADELGGNGEASLFGSARTASADVAALINGGLIHSLEYDDTHTGSIVHGSAVLAATALAVGQSLGASGSATLGAYARGWEVFVRLGLAAPGAFQREGFQITSAAGTMVAALVAADIAGLDEDTAVNAVGIALSQSSGVFEFLTNGSSVKSLHPGWAAHAGVLAARLAKAGMTGPETALEGDRGLYRRFANAPDAAQPLGDLIGDLGTRWHLPDCAFKLHPCCHYLHPFIEGALALRERGLKADDVAELTCGIAQGAAPIVCLPWEAKQAASGHQMRWSLPAVVAAALHDGAISLDTFEGDLSAGARDLAQRIVWKPLEPHNFPTRFEGELSARRRDGSTLDIRLDDVYGNASRPAAEDDVLRKFRQNASRILGPAATRALEEVLLNIDDGGFPLLKQLLTRR